MYESNAISAHVAAATASRAQRAADAVKTREKSCVCEGDDRRRAAFWRDRAFDGDRARQLDDDRLAVAGKDRVDQVEAAVAEMLAAESGARHTRITARAHSHFLSERGASAPLSFDTHGAHTPQN